MKTPGIHGAAIKLIDGGETEVNEIYFDNVEVPLRIALGKKTRAGLTPRCLPRMSGSALRKSAIPSANQEAEENRRDRTGRRRPLIETAASAIASPRWSWKSPHWTSRYCGVLSAEAKKGNPGTGVFGAENQGIGNSANTDELKMEQSVSTRTHLFGVVRAQLARRTGRRGRVGHGEQPLFQCP